MPRGLQTALDELLGNYYIDPTVGAYYEDLRVGARVINRQMFAPCLMGNMREMFLGNPSETRRFVEDGVFLLKYPTGIRNYVSPQCALHTDDPKDYVIRKGADGKCRMYLRRNHAPHDSENLWVGGMTAPRYLTELARKGDEEFLAQESRAIDHLEQDSASKHTVVITVVHGDLHYPIEWLPGESRVLPPTLKVALDMIQEGSKELSEVTDIVALKKYLDWVGDHARYAIDHDAQFAWVAD